MDMNFIDLPDDIIVKLMEYNSNIKYLNKYFYDIYQKNKEHIRKIFIYSFNDSFENLNIILPLNKYQYIGFISMVHKFDPIEDNHGDYFTNNGMLKPYDDMIEFDEGFCNDIDIRIPDEDLTDLYDKKDDMIEFIKENYEVKNNKVYLLLGPDGFISVMMIYDSLFYNPNFNDILSGIEMFNELNAVEIIHV